jgi:hypothetical protein
MNLCTASDLAVLTGVVSNIARDIAGILLHTVDLGSFLTIEYANIVELKTADNYPCLRHMADEVTRAVRKLVHKNHIITVSCAGRHDKSCGT